MGRFGNELIARAEQAADRTIQMVTFFPHGPAGWEIGRQVVRSSASVGANLEEAQAVLTHREFTHRVSIALREARETLYWMRRIEANELVKRDRMTVLRDEWNELVSVLTAVQKKLRAKTNES